MYQEKNCIFKNLMDGKFRSWWMGNLRVYGYKTLQLKSESYKATSHFTKHLRLSYMDFTLNLQRIKHWHYQTQGTLCTQLPTYQGAVPRSSYAHKNNYFEFINQTPQLNSWDNKRQTRSPKRIILKCMTFKRRPCFMSYRVMLSHNQMLNITRKFKRFKPQGIFTATLKNKQTNEIQDNLHQTPHTIISKKCYVFITTFTTLEGRSDLNAPFISK